MIFKSNLKRLKFEKDNQTQIHFKNITTQFTEVTYICITDNISTHILITHKKDN